jgi:hypothetical protein
VVARGPALALSWKAYLPSFLESSLSLYLTDWPAQARCLPPNKRDWLVNELQAQLRAKKQVRDYTTLQALCDGGF